MSRRLDYKRSAYRQHPYCHFCDKRVKKRQCSVFFIKANGKPIRILACRQCISRHRSLLLPEGRVYNLQQFRHEIWEHNPYCHYCWQRLPIFEETTLDHVVPVSKAGQDFPDNLVLACEKCNQQKKNKSYIKFFNETKWLRRGKQMKKSDSYYLGRNCDMGCFVDPWPGSLQARNLDIQLRAYRLWDQAGRPEGKDLDFWLRAEREFEDMVQGW